MCKLPEGWTEYTPLGPGTGVRTREGCCHKFFPLRQALSLPTGLASQGAASFQVGPQTQFS